MCVFVCLRACVCVCLRVYVCHYVSPHAYALNSGGAGADDLCIQAGDVQAMHAFARPDLLKERKSKQRISGFIRKGVCVGCWNSSWTSHRFQPCDCLNEHL